MKQVSKGSVRWLLAKAHGWARRRRYRLIAPLQGIAAGLELLDPPKSVIAGCVYKIRARVSNRSRVTWNPDRGERPRFAAAVSLLPPQRRDCREPSRDPAHRLRPR